MAARAIAPILDFVERPMSTVFVNSYVHGGAAANWWDALTDVVAVYQPKGAADLASSYINLINPGTNNAAPGVAPTWSAADGWIGNGTTQYLTTGITPTSSYSCIMRFSNGTGTNTYLFGSFKSGPTTIFGINPTTGSARQYWNGTGIRQVTGGQTAAVMAIAGTGCYLDGAADGNTTGPANTGLAMFIFALNASGSPSNHKACHIQAVAICSSTQTAQQIADTTTAMAAL
jgi:hypothetical protein